MRPLGKGVCLIALLGLVPCAAAIDFDGLEGEVYGLGFDTPGDVVLVEDGVRMSVENFVLSGSDYFYWAEVVGPGPFPTPSLSLDNISVRFDYADVGFAVDEVTFEFADYGGASNFAVNDDTLFVISPFSDIPVNVAPGVTATVDAGLVTLSGPIQSVVIGGQELFIDNVVGVPEPTTGVLMTLALLTLWRRRRAA